MPLSHYIRYCTTSFIYEVLHSNYHSKTKRGLIKDESKIQ
jgi:hypothetical protein